MQIIELKGGEYLLVAGQLCKMRLYKRSEVPPDGSSEAKVITPP